VTSPESSRRDPAVVSVRVEPMGIDVEVRPGESLMRAAERLGLRWPTICHGHAECTVCCIVVDDAPDAFAPPTAPEIDGLKLFAGRTFYAGKEVRLACQARPVADTVVVKRGVRWATAEP
jgi:2Fe-2S ferredoxin